jgi:hypothetical protein
MNDDDLLKSLGKAVREDRAAESELEQHGLTGSLGQEFEDDLFGKLGIAEAKPEAPRNVIPFPPNRARQGSRVAAGLGMVFAAAAAFVLVQRGGGERLGSYELSGTGDRLERGAEVETNTLTATVGRPLTLVLRPAEKTNVTPEVRVVATFGAAENVWAPRIETSASGALRVTVTPDTAGQGTLTVVLTPKGDTNEAHAQKLARPLDVRATP